MCVMTGGMQKSLLPLKGTGLRGGQPHLGPWKGERATDAGNHSSHVKDKVISSA